MTADGKKNSTDIVLKCKWAADAASQNEVGRECGLAASAISVTEGVLVVASAKRYIYRSVAAAPNESNH
jgi:hypothetical protein